MLDGPRGGHQKSRLIVQSKNGRGDRIRTCDPLLPKQMRYQTAPLPDDHPKEEKGLPLSFPSIKANLDRNPGGPGRIRTYNLAVMSGRLYR